MYNYYIELLIYAQKKDWYFTDVTNRFIPLKKSIKKSKPHT